MASPATSLQETPAPRHLLHHACVLHATHDPPLPVSAAPALQVPTHLHPRADSSLNYHYQHKHVNTAPLPLHCHSGPMLRAAAALHTTTGRTPAPFLHRQHAVQALDAQKDCSIKDRDGLDQSAPMRAMVSRAGGIPICRISNPTSRQVTFSKRRNGLLKKAYELSVLCDAEVGVIIFSATGRLSEFASYSTSMPKLLERYQEYSTGVPSQKNLFQDIEFWRRQVFLLRDQIVYKNDLQSYMLGESLLSMDLNDIQILEHKLEIAINKIRGQKAQLIHAEEEESRRREERLVEENAVLKRKLYEATTLHAFKEQMLMRNDAGKVPWLGGGFMRSSLHQSTPLAREDQCPSASSTFINQDINIPLNLQLGLELFPPKPTG